LQGQAYNTLELTDVDHNNLQDMVLIAVELLYEIKQYDWTVLNPINFIMISLLEFGLTKYPENKSMRVWLIKMYAKLGLAKNVNELSE